MKDLIQYDFNGHGIRTIVDENDDPWFVTKDICEILEISKYRDAVSRLEIDERGSVLVDTPGGKQSVSAINEYGLYSLILISRKPEAKTFKRWVTHNILPSIRKTGTYSIQDKKLLLATALIEANKIIEDQAPKVEAYETFIEARGLYTISAVAKTLDTGQKRLFNLLREKGILMTNNQPYQRYIDSGYFETKWRTLPTGFNYSQTFVTPKGIDYIATIQKILR